MVEIFKITGKRVVGSGVFLILIGAWLLGYFHMAWDLIIHGRWPSIESTGIAVGNILILAGTWIIKIRSSIKRGVQ